MKFSVAILAPSLLILSANIETEAQRQFPLSSLSHRQRFLWQSENSREPLNFHGDQVFRIQIDGSEQIVKELFAMEDDSELVVDFWQEPSIHRQFADLFVRRDSIPQVKKRLQELGTSFECWIENVGALITQQLASSLASKTYDPEWLEMPVNQDPFLKEYHTIEEINSFLDVLVAKRPQLVKQVTIGTSYEEREIRGVVIGADQSTSKQQLVFHGGHHAREWIGPAVMLYLLRSFVGNYGKDPVITRIMDTYDFTIVPVLNVDGYVFSHTKNRMWRKNRQPTNMPLCTGVDPNRNWNASFGTEGASSNPCSEAYHGPSAFSAPEPKAMAQYLEKLQIQTKGRVVSYIDWHAYSQLWMYPWSYTCQIPQKNREMNLVSTSAAQALYAVDRTSFKVGPVCKTIYPASGSSIDYAYGKMGIPYSFAVELRDTGRYGFLLPKEYIDVSGREVIASVTAMLNEIEKIAQEN